MEHSLGSPSSRCPVRCPVCRFESAQEYPALFRRQMLVANEKIYYELKPKFTLFLLEGALNIQFGKKKVPINSRQAMYFSGDQEVEITAVADSRIVLLYFNNNEVLSQRAIYVKSIVCDRCRGEHLPLLNLNAAMMNTLENLRIIESPCWHLMKEFDLFFTLINDYPPEEVYWLLRPTLRADTDFKTFVINNYINQASLEDIARMANLSLSYFMRRFKSVFGIPAHQWLVKQKKEQLVQMLTEGNHNTKEISDKLGFKTPQGLYQFCRNNFGCSITSLTEQIAQNKDSVEPNAE